MLCCNSPNEFSGDLCSTDPLTYGNTFTIEKKRICVVHYLHNLAEAFPFS